MVIGLVYLTISLAVEALHYLGLGIYGFKLRFSQASLMDLGSTRQLRVISNVSVGVRIPLIILL